MATSTPAAGDKSLFWATGLMLFALFFGAGNLIFPAAMGQQAGEHIVSGMLGFMLTGAENELRARLLRAAENVGKR